ncbi:MAG: hypothetical protein ACMVO3_19555 [Thalassobaculum sp.]|jgi:dissimilatory sulfite reductase (desulfoviridin) alpha/beta subunit
MTDVREIVACSPSAACHQAVTRTYTSMRESGADERVAFEAAQKVYSWHHPEVPRTQVPYVIADWLP